jgi:hypothetical protein
MIRESSAILADITQAVGGWGEGAGPNLALAGIEPFNHPEIDSIIRAARKAGTKRLRLNTNAIALGMRDIAEAALANGVRHVRFPLLGSTSESHDMLTGSAGGFDATLRGIAVFSEVAAEMSATTHVSVEIPLCRHNLQDVLNTVPVAAASGASSIVIALQDAHLDLGSAVAWIEAACDTGVVNTVWVEVEGVPYCAVLGWELHLASVYRPVAGDKAPACITCSLNEHCGGVVRGARERILSSLQPPPHARELADRLASGFHPLEPDRG